MTATLVDVSKTYGRTVALHPTTLHLEQGVIGLLGPNGAGKTTMLRLLSTVLAPDAGTTRFGGSSRWSTSPNAAARRSKPSPAGSDDGSPSHRRCSAPPSS